MTDGTNKHEALAAVGKRASEMQPDHIRLIVASSHQWMDPAAVDNHDRAFQALGFEDAGTYTVDVLPVALRFLINETDREYAVIYEHAKAGVWINIVILYEDGTSLTLTNTQDRGLEKRPGHPIVYAHRASADALFDLGAQHARPVMTRKEITPPSIVREFEKAWADGIQWRKGRGISELEVASVFFSRNGQPTRVLRPERIHFVGPQTGAAETAALSRLFDAFRSVEKAYLAKVSYDEVPDATVTLCLFATKPVTLPLVQAMRKTVNNIDLLLVRAGQVERLEAVCPPFYVSRD